MQKQALRQIGFTANELIMLDCVFMYVLNSPLDAMREDIMEAFGEDERGADELVEAVQLRVIQLGNNLLPRIYSKEDRRRMGLLGIEWGEDFGVIDVATGDLLLSGIADGEQNWGIPIVTIEDEDFAVLASGDKDPYGELADWDNVYALLLDPRFDFGRCLRQTSKKARLSEKVQHKKTHPATPSSKPDGGKKPAVNKSKP